MTSVRLSAKSVIAAHSGVERRSVPYPYQAMLAICSDLDETPDARTYWEIMRFLNTTEETAMGPGVGLEVGNSIYFDMPADQFAYWNTDHAGRDMVRTLIRSGHIDCLHSYGDLAATRRHAGQALDELARHNCKLNVWVDHGTAATNFDPLIMHGHGDEPGHAAYHADLTIGYGVTYLWRGRVTSVTGQDIAARLSGIFDPRRPVASGRTLLKEAAKRRLARLGDAKYAMHGPNQTLRPVVLRDTSRAYEFLRCNPHWGGVSSCDQGRRIGEVLTDAMLSRLVERGGVCILYTHLGKTDGPGVCVNPKAVRAFRRLAREAREGRILVTTTRRLLGYRRAVREVACNSRHENGRLFLSLGTKSPETFGKGLSAADLQGLTFHVPDPCKTCVVVEGQGIVPVICNGPDQTGRSSVSLPWPKLEFPRI